jgi:gluconate 2-dehydrogenase gamma chain
MSKLSRRALISGGVLVTSTAALSAIGSQARTISGEVPWAAGEANSPSVSQARFFSKQETQFITAAVDRLIPADELGPGAVAAQVPNFLDLQLAGPYGSAQSWYMQGPWSKGESTQGYQLRLTPAQLYRAAIKAIDSYCTEKFSGKAFADIGAADQDHLLQSLEKGEIELNGVDGKAFFKQLLQNTIEGFFSDPLYGGNHDMIGWKLIGFPGARYDYRPYVAKHNQRLDLTPVGLTTIPDKNEG